MNEFPVLAKHRLENWSSNFRTINKQTINTKWRLRDSRLPEVRISGVIIFGEKIDHMSSCSWRRVRSGSPRSKMSLFRKFHLPKLSKSKAVSGNYIIFKYPALWLQQLPTRGIAGFNGQIKYNIDSRERFCDSPKLAIPSPAPLPAFPACPRQPLDTNPRWW